MNPARSLLLVSAVAFLFITTLGMGSAGMTNSKGQMSGCPLASSPTLCHMSPLEHAFILQNVFTAIPLNSIFLVLLSILLTFSFSFLVPLIWWSVRFLSEQISRPPPGRGKYVPRHTLQEAFSRGILNPKLY